MTLYSSVGLAKTVDLLKQYNREPKVVRIVARYIKSGLGLIQSVVAADIH